MQVLSRNPQKGLDWSFLHKMDAELRADVVDDRQHTIYLEEPLEEIIHEPSDAGIENVFVASIKPHQKRNLNQGLVPMKHGVHSSSSVS